MPHVYIPSPDSVHLPAIIKQRASETLPQQVDTKYCIKGDHVYDNVIIWEEENGITTWPWVVRGKYKFEVVLVLHKEIKDQEHQFKRAVLFAALWQHKHKEQNTAVRFLIPGMERQSDFIEVNKDILKTIEF